MAVMRLAVVHHGLAYGGSITLQQPTSKVIMNSNENITPGDGSSRRKFVLGVGAFSVFATVAAAVGFPLSVKKSAPTCQPVSKKKTMLTQDGQLVEIDEELLASGSKRVSNAELQNWIKK